MTKSQVNERAAFSSDLERFDGIKKSPTSDAFFYCNYCKADTAFKSSQSAATTVYDHVSSAEHKKALSTLHKSNFELL
jgi:hypothetical protein